MKLDYTSIGVRIRQFRLGLGITQAQLSEKAGVEPSNISHIERGATKVSLPTLVAIANALEVTLDDLVYDNLIRNKRITIKHLNDVLCDCDDKELKALTEMIRTTKCILRQWR